MGDRAGGGVVGGHKHQDSRSESWRMGKRTTAGACHKDEAINGPLPQGMPSPAPVTPEERGREMIKNLLGLKLSNCIKW